MHLDKQPLSTHVPSLVRCCSASLVSWVSWETAAAPRESSAPTASSARSWSTRCGGDRGTGWLVWILVVQLCMALN